VYDMGKMSSNSALEPAAFAFRRTHAHAAAAQRRRYAD